MPFTERQCKKFAAMAARGERVPADWKKYCRKNVVKRKKPVKRSMR